MDLFKDKAQDWDTRPVPAQISAGVFGALTAAVDFSPELTVMDFGAGTGLITAKVAPLVKRVLAVDISEAMLEQLRQKVELAGKVEVCCHDLLEMPLGRKVDLVVSAMAMHHVEDTRQLLRAFFDHLEPGGRIALADLDREDGDFHMAGTEGVYHHGFEREALGALVEEVGFTGLGFVTACEVHREGKAYPIFLMTATRA